MIKSIPMQKNQSISFVRRWCAILELRRLILLAVLVLVLHSACAAREREVPLSISDLVENYRQYDENSVLVDACLNVTHHGMSLIDCQKKTPEVIFEAVKGSEEKYQRIVDAGFDNYENKRHIKLKLAGRFEVLDGAYPRYVLNVDDVLRIETESKGNETEAIKPTP